MNGLLHVAAQCWIVHKTLKQGHTAQNPTSESLNVWDVSCRQFEEFKTLLDTYEDVVSQRTISPAPGRNVLDDLLNNDRQFMTVFVPSDSIERRITAYEQERYLALKRGFDPLLLQKVMIIIRYNRQVATVLQLAETHINCSSTIVVLMCENILVSVLSEFGAVYHPPLLVLSYYHPSEILWVMSTSVYIPYTVRCFFYYRCI